jgi:hypothetical protein
MHIELSGAKPRVPSGLHFRKYAGFLHLEYHFADEGFRRYRPRRWQHDNPLSLQAILMSARSTFVYRDGRIVEKHGPEDTRPEPARSSLSCPSYIADALPDIIGPGARPYSSKSELRREYKSRGLMEVGNDAPTQTVDNRKRITKAEIGEAYRKVRDGYRPEALETAIIPDD